MNQAFSDIEEAHGNQHGLSGYHILNAISLKVRSD